MKQVQKNVVDALRNDAVLEDYQQRLDKVTSMRKVGIEPWPVGKTVNATCKDIIDEFAQSKFREYQISERITGIELKAEKIKVVLQDTLYKIELELFYSNNPELYNQFKKFIDIGDIIWVSGFSYKTDKGTLALKVHEFVLQSKCLHPIEQAMDSLKKTQKKYYQRYLDLIAFPSIHETFKKRSLIISSMRNYLEAFGFTEVETPMLHTIPGGATAKPFITHHDAVGMDVYLRIAPELYLKRLIVGGFKDIFEINRNFRNEGISHKHNPEYTTIEFYSASRDYIWAMEFVEMMLKRVTMAACKNFNVTYGDHILDFSQPFRRMSMQNAVLEYGKLEEKDLDEDRIDHKLIKYNISLAEGQCSWGHKLVALFEHLVEPYLVQPTFITHFPIEVSPLSKTDFQDASIAGRFELYIAGMELCNGYNELNDPLHQSDRFKQQAKARAQGDDSAHFYDEEYIEALSYAMPPMVGVGIGIDRLVMLLTNSDSIKDVILFPALTKKSSG